MIQMATSTALLFDAKTETARLVQYDGELETLRELLGVDMVDAVGLNREHVIFVDDEGLFKNYATGFQVTYNKKTVKFVGSGLLVGDMDGENAPLTLNLADLGIEVLKLKYEREQT